MFSHVTPRLRAKYFGLPSGVDGGDGHDEPDPVDRGEAAPTPYAGQVDRRCIQQDGVGSGETLRAQVVLVNMGQAVPR